MKNWFLGLIVLLPFVLGCPSAQEPPVKRTVYLINNAGEVIFQKTITGSLHYDSTGVWWKTASSYECITKSENTSVVVLEGGEVE